MRRFRSLRPFFFIALFALLYLLLAHRIFVSNASKDPSNSLLSRRNDRRWDQLEQHFSHVNLSMMLHQPNSSDRLLTLTYRCHEWCGGWGDRLRGITSTFILAVLTQRRFYIDMPYPCNLETFLQPNRYDWRRDKSQSNRSELYLDTPRNARLAGQIYRMISSQDLLTEWSKYDDIYLTTNSDYITPVLANPHLQDQVRYLNLSLKESNQKALFPLIYEILFRPTAHVINLVDPILQHVEKDKQKELICLHFRIGQNPDMITDKAFVHRNSMVDDVLRFVDRNLTMDEQRSLIFVTSDSSAINARVFEHYPNNKVVSIQGPIIHIDRLSSKRSQVDPCQGLAKALADFYILGECDRLIIAKSGFSDWASRRRLIEKQYDDLYMYCQGVHRVTGPQWRRPHVVC